MKNEALPRDVFINEIFDEAKRNRNIYFISADLGAQALDAFRKELPEQFIHAGICEQNMVDVATGLAQNGKTVYLYAMAPFLTFRCFEQIKVSLASMHLPATLLGVGVGYSYDDAGPTHYATEDISCMRSLAHMEILTASDSHAARLMARLSYTSPALRYIRMDRQALPPIYTEADTFIIEQGLVEVRPGKKIVLFTNGITMKMAFNIRENLLAQGVELALVDVVKLKPISLERIREVISPYDKIVTYEEHFLSGGLGSCILEAMADAGICKPVLRVGIADNYHCENGGRGRLQKLAGIDVESATKKILEFSNRA